MFQKFIAKHQQALAIFSFFGILAAGWKAANSWGQILRNVGAEVSAQHREQTDLMNRRFEELLAPLNEAVSTLTKLSTESEARKMREIVRDELTRGKGGVPK